MPSNADHELNNLMDRASQALVDRQYLLGESLCLQALEMAKSIPDWDTYARIVLPLQECRRHRRMIASEGEIRLGCSSVQNPVELLAQHPTGCILLTQPWSPEQARQLARLARMQNQFFLVLWADSSVNDTTWQLQPFQGTKTVRVSIPAPPPAWRDHWLSPPGIPGIPGHSETPAPGNFGNTPASEISPKTLDLGHRTLDLPTPATQPADWFIDASEHQGNALLASISTPPGTQAYLLELAQAVESACDHEILHQQLAHAARSLHQQSV